MNTTTTAIAGNTQAVPARRFIEAKSGLASRHTADIALQAVAVLMTVLALIPLVWIVGYVIYQGGKSINLELFTEMPRPAGMLGGGVLHSIQGTVILTLLASVFAIPPGIFAAFYVVYWPKTPLGAAVRFATDVLSGVPSIVIGLFCYALLVKTTGHYSALAGGVAMAILMLPTIIRTTEEMLKLVPRTLYEASAALGAPEWKTSLSVMLPTALNGIATGVILGVARAAGETAPLLFTALGNDRFNAAQTFRGSRALGASVPQALLDVVNQPVDSLPLTLYKYASHPSPDRVEQAWATAFVLLVLVLAINITARIWVARQTAKQRGR